VTGGAMFFEYKKPASQGRENFVLTKTKLFLTTAECEGAGIIREYANSRAVG